MRYGLTHVRLLVDDVPRCLAFYRDTLGLTPMYVDEDGNYASLQTPGTTLSLQSRRGFLDALGAGEDAAEPDRCGERLALIFSVDDVSRAAAELERHGVELVSPPEREAGRRPER